MGKSRVLLLTAVVVTLLLIFSCVPQNQGSGGNGGGGGGTTVKDIYGWKLEILNSANPDTGITIPEISGKVIYVSSANAIISDATTAIFVYKANLTNSDIGKKLTIKNAVGKTYSKSLEIDLSSGTKELSEDTSVIEPALLNTALDKTKETRALWDIRYAYVYGEFTGNAGELPNTYEFKYPVGDEKLSISVYKVADVDAIYKPTTTTPATLVGYTKYYNDVWEFVVFPDKIIIELPMVTNARAKYNPNSKLLTLSWESDVTDAAFNIYISDESETTLATTTTSKEVIIPVNEAPKSVGIEIVKGTSKSKILTISKEEIEVVIINPVTGLLASYDDYNGKMYVSWSYDGEAQFKVYTKVAGEYVLKGTTSDKSYSFDLAQGDYNTLEAIAVTPVVDGQEGPSEEVKKENIGYTFAGGDGSESNPYLIGTVNQLKLLNKDAYRTTGKYFKLVADIDLQGANWEPIGTYSSNLAQSAFVGVFDGNGKKVRNLTYNDSSKTNVGLFGYIYNATVKNLILENANITAQAYVGVLSGGAKNSTVEKVGVRNSSVTATNSGNYPYVGGLIGDVNADTGSTNPMIVRQCFADNVTVSAPNNDNARAGGLFGRFYANQTTNSVVEDCYATGQVNFKSTSSSNIGGLIGLVSRNTSGSPLGEVTIRRCYAAVRPGSSGNNNWKGFIGGSSVPASSSSGNNYFDKDVAGENSGSANSSLQAAKTTTEMKQQSTFVGWDFTNIWRINEGQDYPRLRWEY
ncbi:hypothetical protein SAMN04488510_12616 [Fervidobacterium changbaicum]|uniref:GLUG domain-containing protein n=1 Tax=Fervidobacterium changbaicum TaxID=310769 RepID=A0ABX5QT97_9BACT|nr:hypothetical protein [Fervidobacterium changbaicum]QAV33589.1 hypothetical protein CBS1_07545 [Fervidobacterium changbaicum]SDH69305.1 hypothetical protein SAMN04488510_12616 [Fervidobacterium changbaicum]